MNVIKKTCSKVLITPFSESLPSCWKWHRKHFFSVCAWIFLGSNTPIIGKKVYCIRVRGRIECRMKTMNNWWYLYKKIWVHDSRYPPILPLHYSHWSLLQLIYALMQKTPYTNKHLSMWLALVISVSGCPKQSISLWHPTDSWERFILTVTCPLVSRCQLLVTSSPDSQLVLQLYIRQVLVICSCGLSENCPVTPI